MPRTPRRRFPVTSYLITSRKCCVDPLRRPGKLFTALAYVATGRQKHGIKAPVTKRSANKSLIVQMSTKLKRGGYRSRYRLRKQIVEPVFGQIKQARGFRQFLLRGIEQVQSEWAMVCIAHNLCKRPGAR